MSNVMVKFDKNLKRKAAEFAGCDKKIKTEKKVPIYKNAYGFRCLVNTDFFYDVFVRCPNCGNEEKNQLAIPIGMPKNKFLIKNKSLCNSCKCRLK